MDNYISELIAQIHGLLHCIEGYQDAQADFKPNLHFVQDEPKVILFPTRERQLGVPKNQGGESEKYDGGAFPVPRETKRENPDVGTPGEQKQGFVEFTEKEIQQMPAYFKKLIIIQKKRCRIRRHKSGKNSTTYEIRYRAEGYNISACGKTVELAKANFIAKLKTTKPQETQDVLTIPTTFHSFATYYFENFRKEKVTPQTLRIDMSRYNNHIQPFFKEKPLNKITPLDCKTLLNSLKEKNKAKTADDVYSLLSVIFKSAIAHGVLERNPLVMVVHIGHTRENGIALTKDEEKILLDYLSGTIYFLPAALMLYCGLRPNELYTVIIDGDFIKAVNSKRKSRNVEYKRIPIIDRLRPFLPKDGIVTVPTMDILRRRIRAALPNHKLYDLRTTFYTRCKELGVAENALKHFVGHSLGRLGNTYTDLSDEYLLSEGKKLNQW